MPIDPIAKDITAGACDVIAHVNQQVTLVKVDQLTPSKQNARTHSKKQIAQIAESVRKFGFNNPILIDDNGLIIAGHGRLEAAKLLGLAAVPTMRLSHLSPAEKRAYIIADNKIAEKAGWDRELLALELQGLIDLDFEVELTGFDLPEIELILGDGDAARAQDHGPEDSIPEPKPEACVTLPGDLWALGEHRILCGNPLDDADYRRLLNGEKAEFVFTAPPRRISTEGPVGGNGATSRREFAMESGATSKQALTAFLTAVLRHLVAHSLDGSIHDVCLDWCHIEEIMAAGKSAYAELKDLCVWAKKNAGTGSFYRSRHELIFAWKSGTAPHINTLELGQRGGGRTNVWDYPEITSALAARLEKVAPVALVADAIRDCSRRNGLVLDPFVGSGTTVIAAERTGRRTRGIELDPVKVDVAVKRWQDYTGKTATLVSTGETFDEVAETRIKPAATTSVIQPSQPSTIREAA